MAAEVWSGQIQTNQTGSTGPTITTRGMWLPTTLVLFWSKWTYVHDCTCTCKCQYANSVPKSNILVCFEVGIAICLLRGWDCCALHIILTHSITLKSVICDVDCQWDAVYCCHCIPLTSQRTGTLPYMKQWEVMISIQSKCSLNMELSLSKTMWVVCL